MTDFEKINALKSEIVLLLGSVNPDLERYRELSFSLMLHEIQRTETASSDRN